jgi:hypothetical protein
MKKLIEQIDKLLAMLSVSGDSVMLLAEARRALGELYRMAGDSPSPGGPPRASAPTQGGRRTEGEK